MPEAIVLPVEVVGIIVLFAVVVIAYAVARRRFLVYGRWAMLMALRDGRRWRTGMVRMNAHEIEWFSMRGVLFRPTHVWRRHEFELGAPSRPDVPVTSLNDPVQLDCTFGGDDFIVAVSRFDYTALRSWSESAPPGLMQQNVT